MKKFIAILLELIPIICAPVSYLLIVLPLNSPAIKKVIAVTMLLGFLGFAFFFLGRKIAKEDRTVRILGILDILATVAVIAFYVLAFLSIGL